jgi:hypothetical protein
MVKLGNAKLDCASNKGDVLSRLPKVTRAGLVKLIEQSIVVEKNWRKWLRSMGNELARPKIS